MKEKFEKAKLWVKKHETIIKLMIGVAGISYGIGWIDRSRRITFDDMLLNLPVEDAVEVFKSCVDDYPDGDLVDFVIKHYPNK